MKKKCKKKAKMGFNQFKYANQLKMINFRKRSIWKNLHKNPINLSSNLLKSKSQAKTKKTNKKNRRLFKTRKKTKNLKNNHRKSSNHQSKTQIRSKVK